jgi:hypothetical protein
MNRPNPSNRRLDIEWVAMKAGVKPANRVSSAPERADEVETRARREGLAVIRSSHLVEFPGRPPSVILYLARDEAYARSVAEAEAPLLPSLNAKLGIDEELVNHTRLGQILGYPRCCVEEFCLRLRRGITRRLDGGDGHEDFVAAECAARASQQFLGRLNDLSPDRRARIVTFYPCRYDCPTASAYAEAVFAAAMKMDALAAGELRAALLGQMHIAVDGTRGADAIPLAQTLSIDFATF